MSKNKNKQKQEPVNMSPETQKVKMRFTEHKYYNDLNNPIYEAGKVYEIEGAGFIQRWLKRGGIIVEGNLSFPEHIVNESVVKQTVQEEQKQEIKEEIKEEIIEEVIDNSDEE